LKEFTSIEQLKVGQCLKIDGGHPKYNYKSISVKKLVDNGYGIEVILNKRKNWYFNAVYYLQGKSSWVEKVWVLDKFDKRIRRTPCS